MADFDDLDGLDDLGGLDQISFDDTNPVAPAPAAAPQPAAPTGGLGAVIYDLISKRNYQQVIQIAESQKSAIEQDPQVKALVDNARVQLQQEANLKSYLEGARQAVAAGQPQQAEAYVAKAREIDPQHPDLAAFAAPAAAAPMAAPVPMAAPAPAAPMAAPAPAPDLSLDEAPLSFDDSMSALPDLDFAPDPIVPDPVAPAPMAAPAPAAPMAAPMAAPAPAAPMAAPAPAAPAPDPFGGDSDFGDFGDLSLDSESLPAGFEPAGTEAPAPMPDPSAPAPEPEGDSKIPALIQEGREQFKLGQYQSAIDIWSRIFLIDINHAQASRLIEEARGKKAELERQAEEQFHQALDQIEQEQLEEAKATLRQVLELQPAHSTAQDYLNQLEAGQVPVVSRAPDTSEIDLLDDGGMGAFDGMAGAGGEDGQSMEAAVARDRVVVVKRTDRRLVSLAAVVALVVLGGGGFLAMKWDDLFPNTANQQAEAPQMDPIDRATKMFEAGKVENAVLLLEKIGAEDASFTQAQALITQWRSQLESNAPQEETGPSPEMVNRRNLLLKAARDAHASGQFIRAEKYFDRANKILPLETDDVALSRDAAYQLEKLKPFIDQFKEGQYQLIIADLWKLHDSDPTDPDVKLLLVDSYYNLALTDMQRQNPQSAVEKLGEILNLNPGDKDVARLKKFAEAYQKKSPDLLYRIYVKYLPSRS